MSMNARVRHRLELQASELEELFNRNSVGAQVEGGALEPGGVTFTVRLARVMSPIMQRQLEEELLETFSVRTHLQVGSDRATLQITIRQPNALQLCEMLEERIDLAPRMIALGYSSNETPLLLNFNDPSLEHVIFLGGEGAGKTAALRTCALSLALASRQSQVQMMFIDPHCDRPETPLGPGLHALHYLPHALAAVVTDTEDAAEVLHYLEEEAAYRRSHKIHAPTIVLFVDNVDILLDEGPAALRRALQQLLARGAESGIHCILAARPPREGGEERLTALLALKPVLRIVGKVESARQAQAASLLAQSGVENLLGKGDFLIAREEQPVRLQTAFVDAFDLHWCLETMQRNRPPTILARPASARPSYGSRPAQSAPAQQFSFDGRQISFVQQEEFQPSARQ